MQAACVLRQRCLARHPTPSTIRAPSRAALAVPRHPRSSLPPRQHQRRHYRPGDEIREKLQADLNEKLRHARPLVSDAAANRFTTAGTGRGSRTFVALCVAAAFVFYFANSQTVPVTGRRRFNFLSDRLIEMVGAEGAEDVVREIQEQGGRFAPERSWQYREVEKVMSRLVPVSGMADVNWQIRVIDDDSKPALIQRVLPWLTKYRDG